MTILYWKVPFGDMNMVTKSVDRERCGNCQVSVNREMVIIPCSIYFIMYLCLVTQKLWTPEENGKDSNLEVTYCRV